MKTNIFFKYIFFVVLAFLLGTAIYILYRDSNNKNISVESNELEINIVKELNIGITEYDTINPILSYNRDIQYIDKLIFNSLIDITYNFEIENLLAKEVSKINNTTYLIKLEENVYWHDGTKFTAKDVIFTVENLKKGNINSIYKENIKNIQEIQQIDDYTIKIMLNQETPFFKYMLCFPILASHVYEEDTLVSKVTIPVGTGKYKIVSIDENDIKIEKVDYDDNTKIKTINISLKESIKNLYNSFAKNEIDFIITDNIEYEEYLGTMGYNVTCCSNRKFEYIAFNNQNKILSNKEVRKAITYSIDRQRINYDIYNNKYIVCNFPIDYGSYLYNSEDIFEYDINKAKSILIENGWTYKNNRWKKENSLLEFNLVVNKDDEKRTKVAEKIKSQLEEIGIIINVVKVNESRYNSYIKNKNYDIILNGNIISNNPNLETFFGENNTSNFYNEQVEIILNEINNIDSREILKDKYSQIKEIYKEEMPFISLYFNSLFILTTPNLKGDLSHNWYNLFYNIDNWYMVKE